MKKMLIGMFVLGAIASLPTAAQKNDAKKITGSGNVISRNVDVQPFDQLDVSGVYSVVLSQGNKESVRIEADDNLQDLFEVKNEGSKLVIGMKKESNMNVKTKLKVYVTFKSLKKMDLKMVGDLSSESSLNFDDLAIGNKSVGDVKLNLTAQTVTLDNKSVGDVKLNGKASSATINNKGVGSLSAGDFVVQKLDIDNKGVGDATVNATQELIVKETFLGKVTNKGAATVKKKVSI